MKLKFNTRELYQGRKDMASLEVMVGWLHKQKREGK